MIYRCFLGAASGTGGGPGEWVEEILSSLVFFVNTFLFISLLFMYVSVPRQVGPQVVSSWFRILDGVCKPSVLISQSKTIFYEKQYQCLFSCNSLNGRSLISQHLRCAHSSSPLCRLTLWIMGSFVVRRIVLLMVCGLGRLTRILLHSGLRWEATKCKYFFLLLLFVHLFISFHSAYVCTVESLGFGVTVWSVTKEKNKNVGNNIG